MLIVEDVEHDIAPIKNALKKQNIEFDIEGDGFAAVNMFKTQMKAGYTNKKITRNEYGVILMNLDLPIMDGFEATEKIRALETANNYTRTFICGVTATNDKSNIMNKMCSL